uniref:MYND-type domain-containing protein n=1 Tax=Eutreptiella gymnastica TaxID=73025 RepID=A0A7S1I5P6_9EUGL|mmetsp:Transcript_131507/g.227789  ORF Transcript_131507/g.227789 Transcript_131507/m.227789 type:complete len:471 (+) Transcript_131507:56-1468(+)
MNGECAACGAKATLRCSQCKGPYYCSTTCQKTDWKAHKRVCQVPEPVHCCFRVETCETKGKYLVATSGIAIGDLIIDDQAILVVHHTGDLLSSRMAKVLQEVPHFVGSSRGTRTFILVVMYFLDAALKWQAAGNERSTGGPWQVFDLYCPLDKLSTIETEEMASLAATVHGTMLKSGCPNIISPEQMLQLVVIYRDNSLDGPDGTYSSLFATACRAEHNCSPNAYHYLHTSSRVTIRAIAPIKSGSSISIAYIPYYLPHFDRQRALREHYYFECRCHTCVHGLDLARAFVCAHCTGVAHPVGSGGWMCCKCSRGVTTHVMTACRQAEAKLMQQLDVDDEVDIIATLDERLLHPTHYLMYRALVRRVRQEVAFGHYSTVILLSDYLIQGAAQVCGPYSEPLYSNYCLLGRASAAMERPDDAQRCFQRALNIAAVSCGPDSQRHKDVLEELERLNPVPQAPIADSWEDEADP